MNISQEQQERLTAYFEGKLSADDEISFLHEVKDNEALQKEFDWELLLRYQQFKELHQADEQDQPEEFEPADAHIERIREAWKQAGIPPSSPPAPVVWLRRSAIAAAVFILALAASVFYIFYYSKQSSDLVRRPQTVQPDSGQRQEEKRLPVLENKDRILAGNKDKAEKAYRQYYKKYGGSEEDPIQVSKFLYAYNEGRYDEVLNGTPKDLSNKGTNTNASLLKAYLNFYQGISYLHTKKSMPAITKLREVLGQTSLHNQLYYDASWYLAMAYLQSGNLTDASGLLKQLEAGKANTSYKKKAGAIIKIL